MNSNLTNNKFWLGPCEDKKITISETETFEGIMATLISHEDDKFKLMIPIREKDANLISAILEENGKLGESEEEEVIGVFLTMIESWRSAGVYLSGVTVDSFVDPETDIDMFFVHFFLCNQDGYMESMVRANFSHALILVALEGVPIFVTEKLLAKLLGAGPKIEGDEEEEEDLLAEDESDSPIYKIAQDIMRGSTESEDKPPKSLEKDKPTCEKKSTPKKVRKKTDNSEDKAQDGKPKNKKNDQNDNKNGQDEKK